MNEPQEVPVVTAVSDGLAGAESLEAGLRLALARTGETMGWLFGAFWTAAPGGGGLLVRQTWCARAFRGTDFEDASRAHRFAAGEGLPGRVWATGRVLWVEDVQAEVNFPRHAAAAREGLHAAVAFPVSCAGSRLGVVEFYTDSLRSPTPSLLPVFERLGEEIGCFVAGYGTAAGPA